MSTTPLADLSAAGVSIWLDDLSRQRIMSGNLKALIEEKHVVGVTSNPSIFQAALSDADHYAEQLDDLARRGASVDDAVREITTDDVRHACDIFRGVWSETGGVDGRVSLEVDPRNAHKTDATVDEAVDLWKTVDRPNLMIKIPATPEGLPAITRTLAEGISVNVTLIFSVDRYRAVMDAFLAGMEQARSNGHDLSAMASVASFFVSRVDSEVDKRLDAIGTDAALALRGTAAIANARLAYQAYLDVFGTERWATLQGRGRQGAAPALGLDRRQEQGLPGHAVRDRAGRPEHRQHDARGHARRVRRPRRAARGRGVGHGERRGRGVRRAVRGRDRRRRRLPGARGRGRQEVRRPPGRSSSRRCPSSSRRRSPEQS